MSHSVNSEKLTWRSSNFNDCWMVKWVFRVHTCHLLPYLNSYHWTRSTLQFCLWQVGVLRCPNINKSASKIFGNVQTVKCRGCVLRWSLHRSYTQPELELSQSVPLWPLYIFFSLLIYPSNCSFTNSAIHSSLHPSIQTSIHLLHPLTHFTYKRLCWWERVHVRKREVDGKTHMPEGMLNSGINSDWDNNLR